MRKAIKDNALGDSKKIRAIGTATGGNNPKTEQKQLRSRVNEFRNVHIGQFDGPRPTYGRYNVSEQAADILNRQKRNMDMR
jgi:hypothetical protein